VFISEVDGGSCLDLRRGARASARSRGARFRGFLILVVVVGGLVFWLDSLAFFCFGGEPVKLDMESSSSECSLSVVFQSRS